MYYAVFRTHGCEIDDRLYVFDTKTERDRFLERGERHAYDLVVSWEAFAVSASEAKRYASIDDFGDRYATLYLGGVRYAWGQAGYEKQERERERSAA